MKQYQYVEGFQMFHTGLRLRCAACPSLQFYFLSIYIMTYNTRFVFQTKVSITAPAPLTTKLTSKQARLHTTKSGLVFVLKLTELLSIDFDYIRAVALMWG